MGLRYKNYLFFVCDQGCDIRLLDKLTKTELNYVSVSVLQYVVILRFTCKAKKAKNTVF